MPVINGVWKPTHEVDPPDLHEALSNGGIAFIFFFLGGVWLTRYVNPMKRSDEYGARILSLVHALLSTVGCFYAAWVHDGGGFGAQGTRVELNWVMVSMAYFFSDTLLMAVFKWDWMYFMHHVVMLSCTGACLVPDNKWTATMVMAISGGEVTNIFMHTRWLLHEDGYKNSAWTRWMTYFWFVLFFIMRVPMGVVANYHLLPHFPIYFAPMCLGLLFLSWKFLWDAFKSEQRGEWWTG